MLYGHTFPIKSRKDIEFYGFGKNKLSFLGLSLQLNSLLKQDLTMTPYSIEFAKPEDAGALLELVKALAVYEKAEQDVRTTAKDYEDGLRGGLFKAIIARSYSGSIDGMALYYPIFSTWNGMTMYLEDFVVRESLRRQGIGRLLFERWIEDSRSSGAKMLKWQVLDWNEPAKKFYERYGADFIKGWENGIIKL